MRNTRRWLVLLLTAAMLVNVLGIGAAAAENGSPIALSVSPAAEPGSVLELQILATEAQTVADGKLVLTYDAAMLTYADAVAGSAWTDAEAVTLSVNDQTGKLILAFANGDAAAEGVLFTLTFTANDTAETVIKLDGSSYITGVTAELAQEVSTCPSAQFVDLGNLSAEAHGAVDYMVANGYMNGMDSTHFGPYISLNRGMMVTVLYRIAGEPEVEGAPAFTDVPANAYYTVPVAWAAENGITNGITEHLFAPGKELTRQELVTFLYRFAKLMGYDVTASADLSAYTDADTVGNFAREAFEWAVAAGVIKGTTATTLSPANTTTRAQVSLMVYRLLSAQQD